MQDTTVRKSRKKMKYQQDIGEWNESEWEGQGQYAIPIPSITKEDRVARDTTVRPSVRS